MKPTEQDFKKWRSTRRGKVNPEDMTNPYWVWGVENPQSAYAMVEAFNGESSCYEENASWCCERFGQTKTVLTDGTIVQIAGEHEDSYDPDFYIYNDVIVTSPTGKITIYGYTEEDFPPTDFHTATLVGDEIILIGSLGYPDQRDESKTQVLILNTKDWSIQHQPTHDSPGWVSRHDCIYDPDKKLIQISNIQLWNADQDLKEDFSTWELDLTTWKWNCVEVKNWQQFRIRRKDGKRSNLWEIRHSYDMENIGMDTGLGMSSFIEDNDEYDEETKAMLRESFEDMEKEKTKVLKKAKPELLDSLYQPPIPFTEVPRPTVDYDAEDAEAQEDIIDKTYPYNHHRIEINEVQVCFIEEMHEVIMRVEGDLDEKTTEILLKTTSKKLSKIEGAKYTVERL